MKSRRLFLRNSGLAAAAILAQKPINVLAKGQSFFSLGNNQENKLTILHTSDIQNCLGELADSSVYAGLGGFNQAAELIYRIKRTTDNTLLLDAGNFTAASNQKDQLKTVQKMQQLQYDAVHFGINELKKGTAFTESVVTQLPVVASNYEVEGVKTASFKIIQKGKYKIGIISAGPRLRSFVKYKAALQTADALASDLKSNHQCNLVICLSHLGLNTPKGKNDEALANCTSHIDVILGGASNEFLVSPYVLATKQKTEVIVNHIGHSGVVVGKIDVEFDEDGNKRMVHFDNLMVGTTNNRWKRAVA
ncbi:hypothetical protein ACFOWM_11025 [Ferruginibacter yonginensis]|uniref:5'-nucleotidase n=1 Tax=Ferruginibacter yonginensis TaxID=1310416 RepID=A0ABV8QT73_9BACT